MRIPTEKEISVKLLKSINAFQPTEKILRMKYAECRKYMLCSKCGGRLMTWNYYEKIKDANGFAKKVLKHICKRRKRW
jgi:uncharacterized CHY-type Zn-finger protein